MPPQQINNHTTTNSSNTMPFAKAHATAANVDKSSRSSSSFGLNFDQQGSDGAVNMQNQRGHDRVYNAGWTAAFDASTNDPNMTGRPPTVISSMSCDDDSSEYQCLVRKQIELFEARGVDGPNVQGRNRPIVGPSRIPLSLYNATSSIELGSHISSRQALWSLPRAQKASSHLVSTASMFLPKPEQSL
jgi:hypothetical protein